MTEFNKAIIGGLTAAILAEAARYGFHTSSEDITALGVILTAVVPYVTTHALVYFTRNKEKI